MSNVTSNILPRLPGFLENTKRRFSSLSSRYRHRRVPTDRRTVRSKHDKPQKSDESSEFNFAISTTSTKSQEKERKLRTKAKSTRSYSFMAQDRKIRRRFTKVITDLMSSTLVTASGAKRSRRRRIHTPTRMLRGSMTTADRCLERPF